MPVSVCQAKMTAKKEDFTIIFLCVDGKVFSRQPSVFSRFCGADEKPDPEKAAQFRCTHLPPVANKRSAVEPPIQKRRLSLRVPPGGDGFFISPISLISPIF